MIRKDYILKMLEMLADLVAGIIGMIKKGDFQKATESIDQTYQDLLKQDAAFFSKIPLEDLTDKLIQEHHYTNDHLEILAELFYAQAELAYAENKLEESVLFYRKSIALLDFVIKESKTFSVEKQAKIDYMQNRIEESET